MKEKWKCQWSRFPSVLIKMTHPFTFNFTNSYICIILGRKEHKKEYELLGYHRSGFNFRFCYKSHCVTLKVYHTLSQHQFFELWNDDIKWSDYWEFMSLKSSMLCAQYQGPADLCRWNVDELKLSTCVGGRYF